MKTYRNAVVFRCPLEAAPYILMAVSGLLLIIVSQEFVNAGAPAGAHLQALDLG